jgi:hypothetical protein
VGADAFDIYDLLAVVNEARDDVADLLRQHGGRE